MPRSSRVRVKGKLDLSPKAVARRGSLRRRARADEVAEENARMEEEGEGEGEADSDGVGGEPEASSPPASSDVAADDDVAMPDAEQVEDEDSRDAPPPEPAAVAVVVSHDLPVAVAVPEELPAVLPAAAPGAATTIRFVVKPPSAEATTGPRDVRAQPLPQAAPAAAAAIAATGWLGPATAAHVGIPAMMPMHDGNMKNNGTSTSINISSINNPMPMPMPMPMPQTIVPPVTTTAATVAPGPLLPAQQYANPAGAHAGPGAPSNMGAAPRPGPMLLASNGGSAGDLGAPPGLLDSGNHDGDDDDDNASLGSSSSSSSGGDDGSSTSTGSAGAHGARARGEGGGDAEGEVVPTQRIYLAGRMMMYFHPFRDWRGQGSLLEALRGAAAVDAGTRCGGGTEPLARLAALRTAEVPCASYPWIVVGPWFPACTRTDGGHSHECDAYYSLDDTSTGSLTRAPAALGAGSVRDARFVRALLDNSLDQIRRADVVYVRMPTSVAERQTTIAEVGIAHALGKRIYVDDASGMADSFDGWFIQHISEASGATPREYDRLPWRTMKP
jgi:hypothetical protein